MKRAQIHAASGSHDVVVLAANRAFEYRAFESGSFERLAAAGYLAIAVQDRHPLLETSDDEHAAVHLEEVVGREGNVERLVLAHGA